MTTSRQRLIALLTELFSSPDIFGNLTTKKEWRLESISPESLLATYYCLKDVSSGHGLLERKLNDSKKKIKKLRELDTYSHTVTDIQTYSYIGGTPSVYEKPAIMHFLPMCSSKMILLCPKKNTWITCYIFSVCMLMAKLLTNQDM